VGLLAEAWETLSARADLDAALTRCFDAVFAPDQWDAAISELCYAVGGLGGCFHQFGSGERRLRAPVSPRYRDMLHEFLGGGWAAHDLRAKRGWPLAQRGQGIISEHELSTEDERARLPIYQELFRKHDLGAFVGATFKVEGQLWTFNVARSEKMGLFEGEAITRLNLARPYLLRLTAFSQAMAFSASQGALAAFEHSDIGAVLMDGRGHVAEMNAPARMLLGDGLSVVKRRLVADAADANVALEALIAASVSPWIPRAGVGDAPVIVPKSSGGSLIVSVVPVREHLADHFGLGGALLLVSDPARRKPSSLDLLRRLYGLTLREAEVASLLAGELSVAEVAEATGLKSSSVRQIIKTLFWKTGAKRQSQLVATLSRISAAT
jgi:DNA-binding CsgD family transcriptional regulator